MQNKSATDTSKHSNLNRLFTRKPKKPFRMRGREKASIKNRDSKLPRTKTARATKFYRRAALRRGEVISWKAARETVFSWFAELSERGAL